MFTVVLECNILLSTLVFSAVHHHQTVWCEYQLVCRCAHKIVKSEYLSLSCLSVHPPVHMELLGSHWTDFHEIYLNVFQKSVNRVQVALKSEKNSFIVCIYENILLNSS